MKKLRVAHLVNIIAPYRIPIYEAISPRFDFAIFCRGYEANRTAWQNVETKSSNAYTKRFWG